MFFIGPNNLSSLINFNGFNNLERFGAVPLIAVHRPALRSWPRSPRYPQSQIPSPPPIYTARCRLSVFSLPLRFLSSSTVFSHRQCPPSRIQPSSLRSEGKMMDETDKKISDKKLYTRMRLWEFADKYIFEPIDNAIADSYLSISRADGSMTLIGDLPQCSELQSPKVRIVFGVIGMLRLIVGGYLFVITSRECVGTYLGHPIYKVSALEILPCNLSLDSSSVEQKKMEAEFSTLLNAAEKTYGLYFSYDVNLTLCAQRLNDLSDDSKVLPLWRQADPRFLWNGYMLEALIDNKLDPYLLPVMQGSYQHFEAALGTNIVDVSLIARRCTRRTGTRLWRRGADLDGYVANFVETEQTMQANGFIASFLQVRGSIPLLWEQIVDLTYKPPFQIVQPDEGPRVAQRHFMDLVKRYNSVIAVNLVNKHGSEGRLCERFAQAMESITNDKIQYVHFDFHAVCGHIHFERLFLLYDQIEDFLKKHGYFLIDVEAEKVQEQTGVVRTNCIDCLDRTNVTQSMIGGKMLESQLKQIGIFGDDDAISAYHFFDACFKKMWANHGDDISIQYSGTSALKGDFVRFGKRTMEGIVKDGINALVRYYLNNFADGIKQDATDLLQGHYILSTSRGLASPSQPVGLEAFASMKVASGVVLAGVMFAMLSVRQAKYDLRHLLYALFWLILSIGVASVVKANGRMFTNRPRLFKSRH